MLHIMFTYLLIVIIIVIVLYTLVLEKKDKKHVYVNNKKYKNMVIYEINSYINDLNYIYLLFSFFTKHYKYVIFMNEIKYNRSYIILKNNEIDYKITKNIDNVYIATIKPYNRYEKKIYIKHTNGNNNSAKFIDIKESELLIIYNIFKYGHKLSDNIYYDTINHNYIDYLIPKNISNYYFNNITISDKGYKIISYYINIDDIIYNIDYNDFFKVIYENINILKNIKLKFFTPILYSNINYIYKYIGDLTYVFNNDNTNYIKVPIIVISDKNNSIIVYMKYNNLYKTDGRIYDAKKTKANFNKIKKLILNYNSSEYTYEE